MEEKKQNIAIWTEKYRPKVFEEVVGQDEIIKKVQSLTKALNIPHLLFAGPAGTGKSTLALIVVKELFSVDVVDQPAANNSFFGKRFFSESVQLSAEITDILDRFFNQPDGVEQAIAFLRRYQFNKKTDEQEKNDFMKGESKYPRGSSWFQRMKEKAIGTETKEGGES